MLARRLLLAAAGGGSFVIIETPDIPGLAASPDILPASPSADDEEFDAALSGSWTTFGSPTTVDANATVPSHLYIKAPVSASAQLRGIYRTLPSAPFTVIAKCAATSARTGTGGNMEVGLFLGNGSPGAMENFFYRDAGSSNFDFGIQVWTSPTAFSSTPNTTPATGGYGLHAPFWQKIVYTSATNVSYYFSMDGQLFIPLVTGRNPGITPTVLGFVVYDGAQNTYGCEALWDYMRFS